VRIRHGGGEYATAYAHLSRFASGIADGARVRQGQIIGYVGSTGRSTGPHLHYEILRRGAQVNPVNVKFPTGRKLEGVDLTRFRYARAETDRQMAQVETGALAAARQRE
jgi:murein DD-endopeptidase MepM/ murein hydrolase activator NlpD